MPLNRLRGNLFRAEQAARADDHRRPPQIVARQGRQHGGGPPPPPPAGDPAVRPRLPDWSRFEAYVTHFGRAGLGTGQLHAVMPSVALPCELNGEVECDLMFCNQEQYLFHIIDCYIRYGDGIGMPDKTLASISYAYNQCWMPFGPAKDLTPTEEVRSTTTPRRQS
eukprot:4257735-Pyramimonas_sp.AAC.1